MTNTALQYAEKAPNLYNGMLGFSSPLPHFIAAPMKSHQG